MLDISQHPKFVKTGIAFDSLLQSSYGDKLVWKTSVVRLYEKEEDMDFIKDNVLSKTKNLVFPGHMWNEIANASEQVLTKAAAHKMRIQRKDLSIEHQINFQIYTCIVEHIERKIQKNVEKGRHKARSFSRRVDRNPRGNHKIRRNSRHTKIRCL